MKKTDYNELFISHLSNGSTLSLPVHTIQGENEGPILGLTALIHGNEVAGAEVLRRLYNRIDTEELFGTIKIMPVSNPLAFETSSRHSPTDMNNLNRVFPGKPDGWITEKIADTIAKKFIDEVDAYIDIHSGGSIPIVDYIYIHNDEGLSRAMNFSNLYRPNASYQGTSFSGNTAGYAVSQGKSTVVVEVGGGPNYEKDIEKGVNGLINCMKKLDMLPGELTPPPKQYVMKELKIIRPQHGGILVPEYDYSLVGSVIEEKVLGRIYDPRTFKELEVIKTPFENNLVIMYRGTTQKVNPGDDAYIMGNMDSREIE